MSNVGFIGVGYMGYGMAKNLLKKHNVFIFAHKNRKPINKLKKFGAKELNHIIKSKNKNLIV
jgi:3-hydroxyisobutyrate dehydrogenase and related beta-hydroxyacid dehydrogenases